MRRLLLATKNSHKTDEVRALLGAEWEIEDLNAHPAVPAPEETGTTFAENAAIKAVAVSRIFPGLVLADDSGLEVDALGGVPGVRSARYAGAAGTDADNRLLLLRTLAACSQRTARFRCAMALAEAGGVLGIFEGVVEGAIAAHEKGAGGFGYDALFIPTGHRATFAELPRLVKNALSHRARALAGAIAWLAQRGSPR